MAQVKTPIAEVYTPNGPFGSGPTAVNGRDARKNVNQAAWHDLANDLSPHSLCFKNAPCNIVRIATMLPRRQRSA
jgi:hypothetical protein